MEKDTFNKIIAREIPAEIVYEDEKTLAFLDIGPNTIGHTLVIPKKQFENIFDIDEETMTAVSHTLRVVASAIRDAVGATGVHINSNHGESAGQLVGHLHFHIIPRHDRTEFEFWPRIEYEEGQMKDVAENIRLRLKQS